MIHAGQRGDLRDQNIQETGIQFVNFVFDDGFFREHHGLGRLRIGGEEAPVDEPPVAEVRVVGFLRRHIQDSLDHVLGVFGVLEETFDRGGEELQLYRGVFLFEVFEEGVQKFVGVVDAFGIFADDPDHGRLGLGFVQSLQIFAEGGDDALVAVGIPAEDVFDDDDGFLHHVIDLGLYEFQEYADAAFGRSLQFDGTPSDGAHALAHEIHVHFGGIFLEFQKHLIDVAFADQLDDNFQFFHFDINGIVVLAEKNFDLVLQNMRPFLHDQIDIPQRHVLNLRLRIQQGDQRRSQLPRQIANGVLIGDQLHIRQNDLDGGHDHGRVGVLQPRRDALDDPLRLLSVPRRVLRQGV
mmetsp:Transcript_34025/g.78514  ORF Transcript_34025/g.78514 Transcript_34025/m.78514 type:complete len:352 (+) Transcript_34025:1119-2174(+)